MIKKIVIFTMLCINVQQNLIASQANLPEYSEAVKSLKKDYKNALFLAQTQALDKEVKGFAEFREIQSILTMLEFEPKNVENKLETYLKNQQSRQEKALKIANWHEKMALLREGAGDNFLQSKYEHLNRALIIKSLLELKKSVAVQRPTVSITPVVSDLTDSSIISERTVSPERLIVKNICDDSLDA